MFGIAFAFTGIYELLSNSKRYDPNVEDVAPRKTTIMNKKKSYSKSENGAEGYEGAEQTIRLA